MIMKMNLIEYIIILSFRLLNSEIGNDQRVVRNKGVINKSFRLLNSEIGNDHSKEKSKDKNKDKFSSP